MIQAQTIIDTERTEHRSKPTTIAISRIRLNFPISLSVFLCEVPRGTLRFAARSRRDRDHRGLR